MQFYWSILGKIITEAELDPLGESPVNKGIVEKAEVIVEIASRSQSRASSAPLKSNSPIDLEPSKGFYPIIASVPPEEDIPLLPAHPQILTF